MGDPSPSAGNPGLTDIHAHPALNAFLLDRDLRKHLFSGSTFNPLSTLSDFEMLKKGGVKVLWSALHVPEKAFFASCTHIRLLLGLTRGGRKLLRLSPWECLLEQMDEMERQVERASRSFGIAMARSNRELDEVVASGRMAVVHTVEGAHVLEGKLERLDVLGERGVASITLAHLFPNDVAGHVEGIPPSSKKLLCNPDTGVILEKGLTRFGEQVVERMVTLGMLPDLTHCTPAAKRRVFEIVAGRVPVLATHTGARSLNDVPYNLSDDEIREIHRTGGVVGVIFYPFWLRGSDSAPGLETIWETMLAIRKAAGSWDAVAIGTDFDGFTDPPDDAKDESRLPRVAEMLARKKLSPAEIAAITGANARRVLNAAWR